MQAAVITAVLVKEQGESSGPSPATFGPAPMQTAADATRKLSDEEIAALVAGGRQLMVVGDITNARLVLQQAAEADISETSHDRYGRRLWYEKAKDLGSTEAAVRLERLRSFPNPRR
jgi:hypothetical protein